MKYLLRSYCSPWIFGILKSTTGHALGSISAGRTTISLANQKRSRARRLNSNLRSAKTMRPHRRPLHLLLLNLTYCLVPMTMFWYRRLLLSAGFSTRVGRPGCNLSGWLFVFFFFLFLWVFLFFFFC